MAKLIGGLTQAQARELLCWHRWNGGRKGTPARVRGPLFKMSYLFMFGSRIIVSEMGKAWCEKYQDGVTWD